MSIRSLLFGLLCSLPLIANAATSTFIACTSDTGLTPNTSAAFTPTSGNLIVGIVTATTTTQATATLTSTVGGFTFSQFDATTWNTAQHSIYGFVADALVSDTSSQTVTFDTASDQATGTNICLYQISGITRDGLDAILQSDTNFNGAAVTPTIDFPSSALTGNPTIVGIANQTNPAGITPPTNWTEPGGGDVGYATPDGGAAVAHRDSGFTGTTVTWAAVSPSIWGAIGAEIDTSAAGTAPAFSVSPTAAPAANGVTISGTATGTADITVKAVGVAPGDGIPTCTQIQAGQNDGGTAALATGSDTWVDSVSDNFTATGTNPVPVMDYHICARNGIGDSSVVSLADEDRSPIAGFALTTITSVAATGLCDLDAIFDPDCAVGDVFEYEDDTNESADCNVTIEADGDLVLTPAVGGACDGRQSLEYCPEDVSSATTGLFTAPSCTFATYDTIYVNNEAPDCPIQPSAQIVVLTEDVAMSTIDLKVLADCADPEDDLLTFAATVGTLPVGTALGGTGNKDWTGTPTTENEAGVALTFTVTDVAGDTDTFDLTAYVVNTWAMTDCAGLTLIQCEAAVVVDAPWRELVPGVVVSGTECSEATPGTSISQSPSASTESTASATLSITLAVDCGDPATERKVVFVLTDLTGLVRWVDYIPVVEVIGCEAGRYDEDGCWATLALSSTTGKTAWVDYIPVGVVSQTANKWRYENDGWIPVDDLTP